MVMYSGKVKISYVETRLRMYNNMKVTLNSFLIHIPKKKPF